MIDKHLRLWFAVFVVAVLFGGVGIGVIAERFLRPPDTPPPPPLSAWVAAPPNPYGQPVPAMAMRRLMDTLNLSADQQKKIDDLFAKRRKRLDQIREEVRGKFEAEQNDFRNDINSVLTADQQKRFDQWLREEPMPGVRRGPGGGRPGMGPGMGMGRGRGPRDMGPRR